MAARIGEEVVAKTMKENVCLKRGTSLICKTQSSFLFLCAHRPDGGGLLEKMPDGGLLAGWGRALLGQILRDESRQFRSAKLSRRNWLWRWFLALFFVVVLSLAIGLLRYR
jgi:hypothetical protein